MKYFFSKLVFVIGLFSFVYSYAWGLTGHRIIAQIAENHLYGKTKREIKKLFGKEKLAYWANWPDFIKSDTTAVWRETSTWHYVNVDPQLHFKCFEAALKEQKAPNLYTQIQMLSKKAKNKKLSIQERKVAIIFLVHLIGDLAQPMHSGRAKDLGGNKIKVTYFGHKTNLHSVWDKKLIDSQKYSYTEYANLLDIKTTKEVKEIQKGTLEEWLYDSYKIAYKIYVHTPNNSKLGYDYQYQFNDTLDRQLLYGGLRLAKVLNNVFS